MERHDFDELIDAGDANEVARSSAHPNLPVALAAPALLRALAAFRASQRIWNAVDQCLPRGIA